MGYIPMASKGGGPAGLAEIRAMYALLSNLAFSKIGKVVIYILKYEHHFY